MNEGMEGWPTSLTDATKWLEDSGDDQLSNFLNNTNDLQQSLPSSFFGTSMVMTPSATPATPFPATPAPFNLPYSTPPTNSTPTPMTPQFFPQHVVLEAPKEEFSPQIKEEVLRQQQEILLQQQRLLQHQHQILLQEQQQQLQNQQNQLTVGAGVPSSQVQNLLEQIWNHHRTQNTELAEIRNLQKRMIADAQINKTIYDHLRAVQLQLKGRLDAELNVMEEIFSKCILSLNQLVRWQSLLTQLKIQSKQLELYAKEILQLTDISITQPAVALVLTEQPPTCTFFKEKPTPEPYCIQLLTGALTDVTSVNKIKATVICESNQWRPRGAAKVLAEDTKAMDLQQQMVQFQPKFLVGTRKFVVNLAFSIRARVLMPGAMAGSEVEHSIESDISNPFVVITNESQWAEAEGTLIKKEVFGARTEVPWPYFANVFHLHFIHATRQDVARPARTLQYSEIAYVHEKWFQSKTTVSIKEFDNFWTKWFGKNIHQIRYQRNIGNMWKCGLIYGLMGKDDIERALADERPGSFIIRFSENHSGLFAIAYKHLEGVKHYLVKPDDLSVKKGLADFVNEHPIFVYLLRIATNSEGNPHLIAESKDAVLSPYLSDRPSFADPGYEKLPGQL